MSVAPTQALDHQLEPLVTGVRQVLGKGLPLRPDNVPEVLLALDGVTARSVRPNDPLAGVDALDRLLRRELRRLGLADLRRAAGLLFGIGTSGALLTTRRQQAANAADYNADYFRKKLEPQIVRQLAWQLYQDSLQYVQRAEDGQPFAASGDTPLITEEHVEDVKDLEREILLSRIWSDVYGLREQTLAREAALQKENETCFEEAAGAALWYLARLLTALDHFMERYGKEILHGNASYNAEGLIRLAGWSGEVSTAQARDLRFALVQAGEWSRVDFVRFLKQ